MLEIIIMLLKYKGYWIALVAFCVLLSMIYHQNIIKCGGPGIPFLLSTSTPEQGSEIQQMVNRVYHQVDEKIPKINITEKIKTTSAHHSRVSLKYPKDRYCVGDQLIIQVDVFDYLGKMKTYGGDYLRARMSTSDSGAASSGRIEDFNNGTYHVHFILFWEGTINITVFMMHPSEGASALWIYRNKWHGEVDHVGKFTSYQSEEETVCGLDIDQSKELCDYKDERDEEHFYCIKPEKFSCNSLSHVNSWRRLDKIPFTSIEKSLFDRTNVRVEIPKDFNHIQVLQCGNNISHIKEKCKIGTKLEYPSGYVLKDVWHPKGCNMLAYKTLDTMNTCFKNKFIYIFGDSTLRLWLLYFQKYVKTLTPFSLYDDNWARQLLILDVKKNVKISWKRHTFPFITGSYQSFKEERTIAREIDLIGGDQRTVIVIHIGMHFRAYPIHYFIRRLYNIRRAIERLFIRSPETKVIIKTENTSNMERGSDFHASIHYFIIEIVFKDLNVGFVNGWDMTTAFDTNIIHPPEEVIENEVRMLMTYIC
ncbi:NXPE family member 1-like isoform 2-T2 [Anomaloglossus baeobatrachus]|uniref:NXPE family member 1-like isoform X1 n=2 Tax=Anomaloglossus baeobatrachus TaxID=238106 RepID=UPI003F4F78AD